MTIQFIIAFYAMIQIISATILLYHYIGISFVVEIGGIVILLVITIVESKIST